MGAYGIGVVVVIALVLMVVVVKLVLTFYCKVVRFYLALWSKKDEQKYYKV